MADINVNKKDTTEVVTRIETMPEFSDDFRLFAHCGAKGFVVSKHCKKQVFLLFIRVFKKL